MYKVCGLPVYFWSTTYGISGYDFNNFINYPLIVHVLLPGHERLQNLSADNDNQE